MAHMHYHITYKVPAGYRVLDSVPYTSMEAAQKAISNVPWASYEHPKVKAFKANFCMGMC